MPCIVKISSLEYVQWSKTADSPVSKVLLLNEVKEILTEENRVLAILNKDSFSIDFLLNHLETYGTTDLGKAVNLEFILKYNYLGPNQTPINSANELIQYLKTHF
jgi:hypothetical protein